MKYRKTVKAQFIDRPNRFVGHVLLDGRTETVHVKNTGRCKELLLPGASVWLAESDNPARKTRFDLIAVEKERPGKPPLLINMDPQAPNDAAEEWLKTSGYFGPDAVLRREVTHGNSRFDFYIESEGRKIFLEVKGCTLEQDGIASFPDAPTERGVKHIEELAACLDEGFEACLLFIIQMKEMQLIHPNDATHPAFGEALRKAAEKGVRVLAVDCRITPDSMIPEDPVPVDLYYKSPM